LIGSVGFYARRYFGSVGTCPSNLKFQKGYTSQIAQIEFVPTMTTVSLRGAERRSNLVIQQEIATGFAFAMTLRVNFVGPDSSGQSFVLW
jgi:hypothetical protein